MATRAVFFDLYDTLLESRDLKQHKVNAVLAFNQLMIKAEIELSLKNMSPSGVDIVRNGTTQPNRVRTRPPLK